MSYAKIEQPAWARFFDDFSKLTSDRPVELDLIGLDLGDQIEGERLQLQGITYDHADKTLYVELLGEHGDLEHAITAPSEVYVDIGDSGLRRVVVIDGSGHKQFIELNEPLALPATA